MYVELEPPKNSVYKDGSLNQALDTIFRVKGEVTKLTDKNSGDAIYIVRKNFVHRFDELFEYYRELSAKHG